MAYFVLENPEEQLAASSWLGEGMYKKSISRKKKKDRGKRLKRTSLI